MTWTKGRHTIQYGLNFRFALNTNLNFNNVPNYSFSRNTLLGLGGDINTDVLNFLAPTYGSNVALASGTNVTNAFGPVLGIDEPVRRDLQLHGSGKSDCRSGILCTTSFADHEYEGYIQDAFKWKPNLTITVGLRYSLSGVPYDVNGRQVVPTDPDEPVLCGPSFRRQQRHSKLAAGDFADYLRARRSGQ